MIVLGLILLLVGFFTGISLLYYVGGILLIIGLVLWFAPPARLGGRRYY